MGKGRKCFLDIAPVPLTVSFIYWCVYIRDSITLFVRYRTIQAAREKYYCRRNLFTYQIVKERERERDRERERVREGERNSYTKRG